MKLQNNIVLFSVFFYIAWSASVQNLLERTDELKYSILIADNMNEMPEDIVGTQVTITNPKNKIKYKCILPEPATEEEFTEEEKPLPKIRDFLEPLGQSCLYRLAGWWTYEFCYGKHIRQYHQEKDAPIRPQDEFFLGKQTEADKMKYIDEVVDVSALKDYYSEEYAHGTSCDINGQHRVSEVRYYCSTTDKSTTSITDIKEPASCSYTISVHTPLLCKHPLFAPKKEKISSVWCAPEGVLNEPLINELEEAKKPPPKKMDDTVKPEQVPADVVYFMNTGGNDEEVANVMADVVKQLSARPFESLTQVEQSLLTQIKEQLKAGGVRSGTVEDPEEEVDEEELLLEKQILEKKRKEAAKQQKPIK